MFGETPLYQSVIAAPDLRLLANAIAVGADWSVLPDYLATDYIASGRMAELPTGRPGPESLLYLVRNKAPCATLASPPDRLRTEERS